MSPHEVQQYLQRLDHSKFVLHGSQHLMQVIEPRQAVCASGVGIRNQFGVYATDITQEAIIKAVVHGYEGWELQRDDRIYVWGRNIKLGSGYVYVLPAEKFEPLLPNQFLFISRAPVVPHERIDIGPDVLGAFPEIVLPQYVQDTLMVAQT